MRKLSDESMDRRTDRQVDRQTDRQTEGHTDRRADKQMDRWTDGPTDGEVFNNEIQRNPVIIKLSIMFQRETVKILFRKTKEKQIEES